jgi:hypothetical protein
MPTAAAPEDASTGERRAAARTLRDARLSRLDRLRRFLHYSNLQYGPRGRLAPVLDRPIRRKLLPPWRRAWPRGLEGAEEQGDDGRLPEKVPLVRELGDRLADVADADIIFGAVGQCPACADHRFLSPATLAPETSVTCHKCGHACTIKTAIETALASGAVKKLSDHRVVPGS